MSIKHFLTESLTIAVTLHLFFTVMNWILLLVLRILRWFEASPMQATSCYYQSDYFQTTLVTFCLDFIEFTNMGFTEDSKDKQDTDSYACHSKAPNKSPSKSLSKILYNKIFPWTKHQQTNCWTSGKWININSSVHQFISPDSSFSKYFQPKVSNCG